MFAATAPSLRFVCPFPSHLWVMLHPLSAIILFSGCAEAGICGPPRNLSYHEGIPAAVRKAAFSEVPPVSRRRRQELACEGFASEYWRNQRSNGELAEYISAWSPNGRSTQLCSGISAEEVQSRTKPRE